MGVPAGGSVLASGGYGQLVPAATADSNYNAESVTVEGVDTIVSVDVPTGRRLSESVEHGSVSSVGTSPWYDAMTAYSSAEKEVHEGWQGSVIHRCVLLHWAAMHACAVDSQYMHLH